MAEWLIKNNLIYMLFYQSKSAFPCSSSSIKDRKPEIACIF